MKTKIKEDAVPRWKDYSQPPRQPFTMDYVYFILDRTNEAVKIGFSCAPEMRLTEIQGLCAAKLELLGIMVGSRPLEKTLHRRFAHLRVRPRCEWFKVEGELAEFMESQGLLPRKTATAFTWVG